MKKILLPFIFMAMVAILGGCVGDDIDKLQDQINDLEGKVDDLEESQKNDLLDAIAALNASIAQLQTDLQAEIDAVGSDLSDLGDDVAAHYAELNDKYDAMQESLQTLEEEIANNVSAVYYGNLLTDDDYAALEAQGATIVTGKVAVAKQAHVDALAGVKMVGGNLTISGGTNLTFPELQSAGSDLMISGVADETTVSFPKLTSVGGMFDITNNAGITSVTADVMVLVYGRLGIENNNALVTVEMPMLDLVNELYVNNYNTDMWGAGTLVNLNISETDVVTDVNISYLGFGSNIIIGNVGHDFICQSNSSDTIITSATTIGGDYNISFNNQLVTLEADNLESIGGDLIIQTNGQAPIGPWSTNGAAAAQATGFDELTGFDKVETIGGNVDISFNSSLTKIQAFNNVTSIKGSTINLGQNGDQKTLVEIFTSLTSTGPGVNFWDPVADITINERTEWFIGFTVLEKANNVNLTLEPKMNAFWEYEGDCKVEGFDATTQVKTLRLLTSYITSFSAFASLENIQSYYSPDCLYINMPFDTNVTMCTLQTVFDKFLTGSYKNYIDYTTFWGMTGQMAPADAMAQLTAGCQ